MDRIVIRRVRASDQPSLTAFYAALSAESRHARFLGCSAGIGADVARTLCGADHVHEEGFVAVVPHPAGQQVVVGHVCIVDDGKDRWELAIAVADAYQGRGIGQRLFEAAVDWARATGVTCLTATAFADNSRVLRLLASTPYTAKTTPADAGVVEVAIRVAA